MRPGNRYQAKRKHKRILKEKYANAWHWGSYGQSWNSLVQEVERVQKEHYWPKALNYWNTCYISGCKGYAKDETNGKLRRQGKRIEHEARLSADLEELDEITSSNADYRREFDFWWEIW